MGAKKLLNQQGYALVEIITSITILALVVTAISGAFLSSYKNINISGKKNAEVYEDQQILESRISNRIGTYTNIQIDIPGYSYGPVNVQMKKAQAGALTAFVAE